MNQIEQTLTSMEVAEMNTPKVLYLLLAKDNSVKVGVTNDFEKRLKVIENQSGKKIVCTYVTQYCSNSYEIEADFKKNFKQNHLKGEWYEVNFNEVKEYLEKIFKLNAKSAKSAKVKNNYPKFDKLLDFVFEGRY